MKILESWLREWVNPAVNTKALCHQLTMAGLEVDDFGPLAPAFSGVVVGRIVDITPHPDADKLHVCMVNIGDAQPLQIVCGANNAVVGINVPVAIVGAKLPGDFNIKKGKLRGVESYGMLCGAGEIGLTETVDGLFVLPNDAPIGKDIREYLQLDDQIIDVSITPNRGDCFSIKGLAREISVINSLPLNSPTTDKIAVSNISRQLSVSVTTPEACPRYLARVIEGINPQTNTPSYISNRLTSCGIQQHSFVVDITNYVMLELGQPLHAFDADKIQGNIQVRMAVTGETITLLNDQPIILKDDCLVIADDQQAHALAGVMGGVDSSISSTTANIVLESAHFAPISIAGRARRYGLHTDASQRFERGVDYNLPLEAMERATALILAHAGGQAGSVLLSESTNNLPSQNSFSVSLTSIRQRLGFDVSAEFVQATLDSLSISAVMGDQATWQVTAPSHRFDITIPEDISEEIARIYGYDNIPIKMPHFAMQLPTYTDHTTTQQTKQTLVTLGYQEAVSFSFVDQKIVDILGQGPTLELANPISSELGVMRPSLLASLIPCIQYNLNRQQQRVRLFEMGLRFVGTSEDIKALQQIPTLSFVATGALTTEQWRGKSAQIDFYQFKSEVEQVLSIDHPSEITTTRSETPWMHPGLAADLIHNGQKIGYYGKVHPSIEKTLDLLPTWVCEINSCIVARPLQFNVQAPSKYPSVRRDLALIVDNNIEAQALLSAAILAAGEWHLDSWIFDVYEGDSIGAGKKSIALAITWQHGDRTLAEDEIKQSFAHVISTLESKFTAQLRSL